MSNLTNPHHKLISITEVRERTTLSNSSIYRLMRMGHFPKNIKLSTQSVAWNEQDVEDWIQSRIEASQAA